MRGVKMTRYAFIPEDDEGGGDACSIHSFETDDDAIEYAKEIISDDLNIWGRDKLFVAKIIGSVCGDVKYEREDNS